MHDVYRSRSDNRHSLFHTRLEMACLVDKVGICVRCSTGGSVIYSLNEDAETIRTLKVASSGQLLVRSSRAVYLLNETGHREGSRQVRAISSSSLTTCRPIPPCSVRIHLVS